MIGPLEIVILLVIILLVTGLYRKLPALGRSAGTQARVGGEKAREFADRTAPKAKELASKASTKGSEVGAKVADSIDVEDIGRKAGKGAREARDLRAEFKGFLDAPAPSSKPKDPAPAAQPATGTPAAVDAPGPAADAERRPDSEVETGAADEESSS